MKTLKPRLGTQSGPLVTMEPGAWGVGLTAAEKGYTSRWARARALWLNEHPLCVMCERPTPATVVDHIKPHRGDKVLFWDRKNWQSLCKLHHDSHKQKAENKNFREKGIGG